MKVEEFARILYDEMAKNGFNTIEARDAIAVAGSEHQKSKLTDDQFALDQMLGAVLQRIKKHDRR